MLARFFLGFWMALAVLSPATAAHAEVPCTYMPGAVRALQAQHKADIDAIKNKGTIVLKAGTLIQTDSSKHLWVMGKVLCLAVDVVLIYDVDKVDAAGYVHEGFMADCGNWTKPISPIFVGRVYTDKDWINALRASRWRVEDLIGPCNASYKWKVYPNGTVLLADIIRNDCKCAVPWKPRKETDVDPKFVKRAQDTPLSQTLELTLSEVDDPPTGVAPATAAAGTVVSVPAGPPALDYASIREGIISFWTDNDSTGMGGIIDHSRWSSHGEVTWYYFGTCDTRPKIGAQVGGGVVIVGAGDHYVLGAFGVLTIRQNSVGGRLGGYIGADPTTSTVSGMPLVGPEFRLFDGRHVQIWAGADFVAPMGPSWAALGGQGHIGLDGVLGNGRVTLGAEIGVGGVGAVAGDCESGSLVSSNLRVGF